jgi:hypothetical protein
MEESLMLDEPTSDEHFHADRTEKVKGSLFIVGAVLSIVGITLVLFLGYLFWFTGIKADRAQHELLNEFTSAQAAIPLSGKLPPIGAPAAILTIPQLGLKEVVVQGAGPAQTAQGLGLVSGTARPGTIGNAVIVGRRLTAGAPFAHLNELRRGDRIEIAAGLGLIHYVVSSAGTVGPGQKSPASPVNKPQVTLMTNGGSFSSNDIYYVVARQITAPGAAGKPNTKPSASQLGLAGDSGALPGVIIFGLLYVGFLAGAVIALKRRRDQFWTIYLLTLPVVLALALCWFQSLYLLLPSSM